MADAGQIDTKPVQIPEKPENPVPEDTSLTARLTASARQEAQDLSLIHISTREKGVILRDVAVRNMVTAIENEFYRPGDFHEN